MNRLSPTPISNGPMNIVEISAGAALTCVRTEVGGVACWGPGYTGIEWISNINIASSISVGANHACARLSGDIAVCWGNNNSGQIGDGTTTARTRPVVPRNLPAVTQIVAGQWNTCARLTDGTARCWGSNIDGQLGDGARSIRSTPGVVPDLVGVSEVSAARFHTCARMSDATVRCWGSNSQGQLGDGTSENSSSPRFVGGIADITQVSTGGLGTTCALRRDGAVFCWGRSGFSPLPTLVEGVSRVREIAAATTSTCARRADDVLCWSVFNVAMPPIPLTGVIGIDAGYGYNCVLKMDVTVWCWGNNDRGQLGDGSTTTRSSPAQVTNLTEVIGIGLGPFHACARKRDGSVWCWGDNTSGQIGDGVTSEPRLTPVRSSVSDVAELSLGDDYSCARFVNGTVRCWGANANGQLGDGSTTARLSPVQVINLPPSVVSISAGGLHTCARMADGTLRCWGANWHGALGLWPYGPAIVSR